MKSSKLYAVLLRLLPRHRRDLHGDEMARVFADLETAARRERGAAGVLALWAGEIAGLMRFACRERFGFTDVRWALRAIRRRGWSAALAVGLIALAIAANAVVFSVADSLVFHRVTYRDAARLVHIENAKSPYPDSMMTPALLDAWKGHRDVLAGASGYLTKYIFLQDGGSAERVATADVMPGMLELLGAVPRWGRSLIDQDAFAQDVDVALISETLARARFGDPRLALGRDIATTAFPLRVVGVMPSSFRFPSDRVQIWRALDPRGDLAKNFAGVSVITRLADGLTIESADAVIRTRSQEVAAGAGWTRPYEGRLAPLDQTRSSADSRKLFLILVAAAACLLLIACANVASLELAAAMSHARAYGIQLALGASRGRLVRVALLEAALLNAAALTLAVWLASMGVGILRDYLPAGLMRSAVNPIDLDARAIVFMAVATCTCWLLSSLPALVHASGSSLLELMKQDNRVQSAAGGAVIMRRLLTVGQVAVAVTLLLGSLLFARSYAALLRVDKGFDSRAVATLDFTVPPQMLGQRRVVTQELLARLTTLPGVVAVMSDPPPNDADSPSLLASFDVDGRATPVEGVRLARKQVSAGYFDVLSIPLRAGRFFARNEPATHVIVDERMARKFWPNGAIGHVFRPGIGQPVYEIVGVAGHVRSESARQSGRASSEFRFYTPAPPPVMAAAGPVPAPTPRTRVTGASYGFIPLTLKLDAPSRAEEVFREARAIAPQFQMEGALLDDKYASFEDDSLLVTRVVSGFGAFAFVVAMAGVYGVMVFIVTGRRREIGIRMALGASRREIGRLVLGSSLRLALAGAVLGLGVALAASRWFESQLFGVEATDPWSYVVVAVAVLVTAAAATWHPAYRATRVNPVVTLQAE
jgi:putative ABC transport system permease protein